MPLAHLVRPAPVAGPLADTIALTHEERLLRRRRLVGDGGLALLVDLPRMTALAPGDALELADGRLVGITAAPEALVEVRGDLPRLAWHIGNRHAPCQIGPDCLIVRAERVMEAMLTGLGAALTPRRAAFFPEGGAYGPAHGAGGHGHGHGHGDDHGHGHGPAGDLGPRLGGDAGHGAFDPQGLHGRGRETGQDHADLAAPGSGPRPPDAAVTAPVAGPAPRTAG